MEDENKIREEVERFAATHDDMRLPADWLKHIPCNWECYYRYKMYKDWPEDKEFLLNGVLPFLGVMFASYVFLVLFVAVFGE